MIKFFRKIRYHLLKEGKISGYLQYGIGEIFLVVIGILIALSINNWNERRTLDQQEKSYLNRLVQETKSDLQTFTAEIERLEINNEKIANLTHAINDENSNDSLLIHFASEFLIYGTLYPSFNPSTTTYEDLSSTGNLSNIKDERIRDQIVAHYQRYQAIEWDFRVNADWSMPIDAPLFIQTDALVFDTKITSFLFPKKSKEKLAEDIRRNADLYLRNAAAHYWINADCTRMLQEVKHETSSIIDVLEKQLELKAQ